jgi:hypothetical protein
MSDLASGAVAAPRDPFDGRGDGAINVFGIPVYASLIQSFRGRSLVGELGQGLHPLFALVSGAGKRPRREEQDAVEGLTRAGLNPDVGTVGDAVAWWMSGVRHERDGAHRIANEALSSTTEWLLRELTRVRTVP